MKNHTQNESKSRVLVHPRDEEKFKKEVYIDLTHWFGYISNNSAAVSVSGLTCSLHKHHT